LRQRLAPLPQQLSLVLDRSIGVKESQFIGDPRMSVAKSCSIIAWAR